MQADIVGRRLGGRHKLPWNSSKSWAGSGAMFLGERSSMPFTLEQDEHRLQYHFGVGFPAGRRIVSATGLCTLL